MQTFEPLAAFMQKRHQIYLDRKAGKPWPWTDDPILQQGRFCNVFRELDTVTIWIKENIREPFKDDPNLWFMLAIARYINWPPTLARLMATLGAWPVTTSSGGHFSPEKMTAVLEQIAREGKKVYTGAYMIRAESCPDRPWYSWSKHRYICEVVLGRLWADRFLLKVYVESVVTLENLWLRLQAPEYIGWGPFMAYEWVTDLRHTRYGREALDIYTWANAGPGAIRGLNRLEGRKVTDKPHPGRTLQEMRNLQFLLNTYNDPGFNSVFPDRFEMRDIEHSLCEFDKYERVRLGQGRMRTTYQKPGEMDK